MGRGYPALWSLLLGTPPAVVGWRLLEADRYLRSFGRPLIGLGVFVVVVGMLVQYVTPEPPVFREDEHVVEARTPNQRPALVKSVLSVPTFLAAAYLLYYTEEPYVYPTVAFFLGLYLYTSGIIQYWRNALTEYYLTDQRLISVYRFMGLDRKEISLENIRLVQERKSVWEKLTSLGNVRSAAGVADLQITATNIRDPGDFAEEIRERTP